MRASQGPSISALVVNRNTGDCLERCLKHLAAIAGTWRSGDGASSGAAARLDVVVVDNASSDGSAAMVRQFASSVSSILPVRLLASRRNRGFGAACNLAATNSAGRHLLLLNPDAWIDEESLRHLSDALKSDDRLGAAAPLLQYPDGSPQFGWSPPVGVPGEAIQRLRNRFEKLRWNHSLLPRLLRPLVGDGWFSAACLLVRRFAFETVGGFDEGFFLYFEDADLGLRLRRAGFRQVQVAGARAWHVRGAATGAGRERSLTPEVEIVYRASQLRYYDLHRPGHERRYLRRRLRRKCAAVKSEEQRRALLDLLEEA